MLDLPDFQPLNVQHGVASRGAFHGLDHVLILVSPDAASTRLRQLPEGRELERMFTLARRRGAKKITSRLRNDRASGVTIAVFEASAAFAELSLARELVAECLRDRPRTLGLALVGHTSDASSRAVTGIVAAASAAAFALPSFKSTKPDNRPRLKSLKIIGVKPHVELGQVRAQALGNNIARWFTALPPNVLTATAYRRSIERLIGAYSIRSRFLGERELKRLKAGAFLAVAQGNATRDAGILHLRYRPRASVRRGIALVGKGVLFDTGGTNIKTFKGMLDMHTDMQGSAVALGTCVALAELKVPYAVDAWLAITENRLSPEAYKSQDVVRAANGTSIQVIHTDAEGRMVLADTLALAARERPHVVIDYATLTGSCVAALTDRYSGVFCNRAGANELLIRAGAASGERVWPFPMDDDFDDLLKSDIADIKQCTVESEGDHILGARFLNRFVPRSIPWIHVDLAAGQHRGGLAHVPSDITGFGVRFTLELLRGQAASAEELASRLSA
jgi:leucyl aminopeptidase